MKVYDILRKHTGTVNSFVDDTGHNHFTECVEEIEKSVTKEKIKLLKSILANVSDETQQNVEDELTRLTNHN